MRSGVLVRLLYLTCDEMYLTFHITDNNPLTRPTDWDGAWLTGDHALFVIPEKNRRFGEPSVVMRRTHRLQNEKLFATELTTEQPSSTYIYLLSIEIFLRSHFPSESCFQCFTLCIPVLH